MSQSDKALLALQDAAIQDILSDYLELRKSVNTFTEDFNSLKIVVEKFPENIDDKVNERILNLNETLNEFEKVTTTFKNETITETEDKLDSLKYSLAASLNKNIGEVLEPKIKEIKEISESLDKRNKGNSKFFTVSLNVVCSFISATAVLVGVSLFDVKQSEELKTTIVGIDQAARAAAESLPESQKKIFINRYENLIN